MRERSERRRFRFSLRTLFVLLSVFAVALGWLTWNIRQVKLRDEAIGVVRAKSPYWDFRDATAANQIPWMWRLLGARPMGSISFSSDGLSEQECRQVQRAFPEAEVICGPGMPWITVLGMRPMRSRVNLWPGTPSRGRPR